MNEAVKKYELRELTSQDIFLMSKIIRKIGVANFKRCLDNEDVKTAIADYLAGENNDKEKKGEKKKRLEGITLAGVDITFQIVDVIFERLPECETELYGFLSSLSGLKIAQLQKLSMADFFEMVVDVIKKPEFKDFFKVASRLFK